MIYRTSRRFILLFALCATLGACREDDDRTLEATASAEAPAEVQVWLEPTSDEAPGAFLAKLSGEDVAQIDALLTDAAALYRENTRMIANRIGQLWVANRRAGDSTTVVQLLTEFTQIDPGAEKSIGPRIQQYRVLREQGLDHGSAIERLREGQ